MKAEIEYLTPFDYYSTVKGYSNPTYRRDDMVEVFSNDEEALFVVFCKDEIISVVVINGSLVNYNERVDYLSDNEIYFPIIIEDGVLLKGEVCKYFSTIGDRCFEKLPTMVKSAR